MALYKVTENGDAKTARLVKAANPATALRHVAASRFKVDAITNPMEAADLVSNGMPVETANAEAEVKPDTAQSEGEADAKPEADAKTKTKETATA